MSIFLPLIWYKHMKKLMIFIESTSVELRNLDWILSISIAFVNHVSIFVWTVFFRFFTNFYVRHWIQINILTILYFLSVSLQNYVIGTLRFLILTNDLPTNDMIYYFLFKFTKNHFYYSIIIRILGICR